MAVTSAQNMSGADGGFDEKGDRNYTEEWQVFTDDVNDHASTVLVSDMIPQMFDLYLPGNSFDSGAYVNRKSARRDPDVRTLWHVTINYSTAGASNAGRDGDGRKPDNPLDEAEVVTYRTGAEERVMEEAYKGTADAFFVTQAEIALGKRPVVNSANDAFDPPYMKPDYYRIITITRNEANYDDFVASNLIGTCNASEFRGKDKHTLRLADVTADELRKAGQIYHRVTYELHYRELTWTIRAQDAGFNVLDAGNLVPARDANDARYGTPVLLDGAGAQRAVGAAAVYFPYLPHDPADWGPLNLDA